MRLFLPVTPLAGLLLFTTMLRAQSITTVEPLTAKAGGTVSAKGEGIDSSKVDTLYLKDGYPRLQMPNGGADGNRHQVQGARHDATGPLDGHDPY